MPSTMLGQHPGPVRAPVVSRCRGEPGAGKPGRPHPMLRHAWPAEVQVPGLELSELREAIAAAGIPMAVEQRRRDTEPVALSVINRLTWRGGPGDRLLAEDLLAGLRREPLTGRVVPVDLDMLSTVLEGDPELSTDGYLDLRTGQVYDDSAFVRFRDVLDGENLSEQWYAFSADRQMGRAREYLADHGIRVG